MAAQWCTDLIQVTTGSAMRVHIRALEIEHKPRVPFDRGYINRTVSWELKHIPRGEKRSLQNFLRFAYNALRRKHLTLGKTRHETLKELVEKIQEAHPDFTSIYDKDVFKI